jgi:biopolymer transport protein TolQ
LHFSLMTASLFLLPDPGKGSLWEDIAGMTLFSKGIMVILLFMSVVSWTIIAFKYFRTKKIHGQTDRFLREFRRRSGMDSFLKTARAIRSTPLSGMLDTAYDEIRGMVGRGSRSAGGGSIGNPVPRRAVTDEDLDLVADAIDRAGAEEVAHLDTGIIFLATTANAAPFLGLLGTVVGIYAAFKDIGARGTATLGVVAPAIAEALIATAAGLAVAIPALVGYNYFVSRNRLLSDRIDNFKSELFSAFKKELDTVEEV